MSSQDQMYFEDVEIGDELGPIERVADPEMIKAFMEVSNRRGPSVFNDPDTAKKAGWEAPVTPGHMLMAFISQLLSRWFGQVWIRDIDLILRRPLLVNQQVRVTGIVTDKSLIDGRGHVECDVILYNADGERTSTGKASVTVPLKNPGDRDS
jgi:acyl dehydratase